MDKITARDTSGAPATRHGSPGGRGRPSRGPGPDVGPAPAGGSAPRPGVAVNWQREGHRRRDVVEDDAGDDRADGQGREQGHGPHADELAALPAAGNRVADQRQGGGQERGRAETGEGLPGPQRRSRRNTASARATTAGARRGRKLTPLLIEGMESRDPTGPFPLRAACCTVRSPRQHRKRTGRRNRPWTTAPGRGCPRPRKARYGGRLPLRTPYPQPRRPTRPLPILRSTGGSNYLASHMFTATVVMCPAT